MGTINQPEERIDSQVSLEAAHKIVDNNPELVKPFITLVVQQTNCPYDQLDLEVRRVLARLLASHGKFPDPQDATDVAEFTTLMKKDVLPLLSGDDNAREYIKQLLSGPEYAADRAKSEEQYANAQRVFTEMHGRAPDPLDDDDSGAVFALIRSINKSKIDPFAN